MDKIEMEQFDALSEKYDKLVEVLRELANCNNWNSSMQYGPYGGYVQWTWLGKDPIVWLEDVLDNA